MENAKTKEMSLEELREENKELKKKLEDTWGQMGKYHTYSKRLELGIAKALEPYVFFHLAPWSGDSRYLNRGDKSTILKHLAKLLMPLAKILSPDAQIKQLQFLVKQSYSSFVNAYGMVDCDASIKWDGEEYRVKDKKGIDPYVLQITGDKKTKYHKKGLQFLMKDLE